MTDFLQHINRTMLGALRISTYLTTGLLVVGGISSALHWLLSAFGLPPLAVWTISAFVFVLCSILAGMFYLLVDLLSQIITLQKRHEAQQEEILARISNI